MNSDTSTLSNNRLANSLSSANGIGVKYARLQGYLEGYLDQMSASKDAQEELISKLLSELGDILNPLAGSGKNNEDR
jgi:hypothetical protein